MFVSLGCDKNLVDTEMMLGMLSEMGYSFTDNEYEAEIIVVNTCCFIGDAKEESINTLIELGALKNEEQAKLKLLIASGCLAQRYSKEIRQDIPEVDVIVGTMSIDHITDAVKTLEVHEEKVQKEYLEDINRAPVCGKKRILTTGGHYAYMKIAEGCEKHCTYCIIPKVRGAYRSVPMEVLLSEAKTLADQGVKELILVAQETTLYGVDLYGEKRLPLLLKELAKIPGIYWIRLLYCYPEEITDELITCMKEEDKICHYLDIPIQSAADDVLRRMGRRCTQQQLRDLIAKLRKEIPDICLRTTLITGFPGETEEHHEQTISFVDEMEFDRLGVFPYSPEENTPAADFENQISEEVKKQRQADIMELQQEIAFDKAEDKVGMTVWAMIEGKVADENAFVGRTYMDAPNVDGFVFVNANQELMTGDFVKVRITGSYEYDLLGELADENEFTK